MKRLTLLLLAFLVGSWMQVQHARAIVVTQPAASGWTTVTKATDESITSDSTITADGTLTTPSLAASAKIRFRTSIWYTAAAAADFKWEVIGPSSPSTFRSIYHQGNTGTTGTWDSTVRTVYPSASIDRGADFSGWVYIEGILHNGSNAGPLAIGWAQGTSDAGATVLRAGSWLEYKAVP